MILGKAGTGKSCVINEISSILGYHCAIAIDARKGVWHMGQCYFQLQTLINLWASAERIHGFELIDFL